jgi:S1-C subfamily serine protease
VLGVDLAPDHYVRRLGIEGALVLHVLRGGGAERAGMRPTGYDRRGRVVLGDVIIAVEGEPVRTSYDLRLALEQREVGDEVLVTVLREGREKDLTVVLGRGR